VVVAVAGGCDCPALVAVALVVVVAVFVTVVAAVVVAVDVAFLDMNKKAIEKREKRENNPCLNNFGNAMRFVWKLECASVKKVVCAFRSRADPGLQARVVQKLFQKSMFFESLFL